MDAAIAPIKPGVATVEIARAFPRAQDIGFDGGVRLSALPGGVPMPPLRKTAIAVPHDLLAAVDRAARERHESRNRFVTLVLRHAVRARRDAEITRRLNELFATPDLAKQHSREASELDDIGTDWSDERW